MFSRTSDLFLAVTSAAVVRKNSIRSSFRADTLSGLVLAQYLGAHQPELLNRLKINVRIKEELARALESLDRN